VQSKFSGVRQREQADAPALISERESKVIFQRLADIQMGVDALSLDVERLLREEGSK
jgi:hypothetical protein